MAVVAAAAVAAAVAEEVMIGYQAVMNAAAAPL